MPPSAAADVLPATMRAPAAVLDHSLPVNERSAVLGADWRKVPDRAVVSTGDAAGFHVLVADSTAGYEWRTVATLSEPGMETDRWIGNMCVTGSGKRAVVVYAPRHFANREYLAERGGFTAVVDLETGAVTKLPVTTSLAYFNPGCGAGETAVLTQGGGDDLRDTRLSTLDAAAGRLDAAVVVEGQVTSPVPTSGGIVAAVGGGLVSVSPDAKTSVLIRTAGAPYRVTADLDGGVVFLEGDTKQARARRVSFGTGGATATTLATGAPTELSVAAGRGGQVFITGPGVRAQGGALPQSVHVSAVATRATVSLSGAIAVTKMSMSALRDPKLAPSSAADELPVDITATALATGKEFTLAAVPAPTGGSGAEFSPALAEVAMAGDPHDPTDAALRTCGVLRNDPRNQPIQVKPRQVEWTVNQLVLSSLAVNRPADWNNLGMPSYSVSNWFGQEELVGGGRVPAQILLGIALAESNLTQAAAFAVPGVSANPLISNYYGVADRSGEVTDWLINFREADCGYGVMQITDGMRKPGTERPGKDTPARPHDKQRAIALDFVANIAEGQRILASKWNASRSDGMQLNGGDSGYLENWFYALWAYNSGYHPKSEQGANGGAWGVGWFNNPINPRYDRGREPFMRNPDDGRHPQDWPYPEKVLGYAGYPVHLIESPGVMVPAFRPAGWPNEVDKLRMKPPVDLFCNNSNSCSPTDPTHHYCVRTDFKCWYNQTTAWKPGCDTGCGQQFIRFHANYPYQEDGTAYGPNCGLGGLPANARIVDNLPTSVPSIRPGCTKNFTNAGSFGFTFAANSVGTYQGKIDMHQLGTGFGGHVWMGNSNRSPNMGATGTWTMNQSVGPWARVLVHLPVVGARTQQARYEIDVDGSGAFRKFRHLPQEIQRNGWVSLGVYNFTANPRVRLSNITKDGRGADRVAWDAIAVQPLPGKPKHIVAALGDSYTSGEGASNYYAESDVNHGTARWNACRRSRNAWPRKLVIPGNVTDLGTLSDRFDPNHELGFVACSGAKTSNVRGIGQPEYWTDPAVNPEDGQFREIGQIDSGVLTEHTTLVVLTIGGNDGNAFVSALRQCTAEIGVCSDDPGFLPRFKALADEAQPFIASTIRLIKLGAPNAKILLVSYPRLLSEFNNCNPLLEGRERDLLNELANHMADKQRATVQELHDDGAPAYFADARDKFRFHGVCDEAEWVNGVVAGPTGDGDFHEGDPNAFCFWDVVGGDCISRESFHPKLAGTTGYGELVSQRLGQIGYN